MEALEQDHAFLKEKLAVEKIKLELESEQLKLQFERQRLEIQLQQGFFEFL